MRWTRTELLKGSGHIDFENDVEISDDVFATSVLIHSVKDVHIWGSGYLDDDNDRFFCQLNVAGTMIVPDSITDEEIELEFETGSDEVFVFGDTDEDGARIVTDEVIDLLPAVIEDILLEVPLEVTNAADDELPEGDGWKVYTEAEYEKTRSEQMDPRLAKLMEFKSEK
ncbi:MAG: YceD family protein [Bulleidia sp.]